MGEDLMHEVRGILKWIANTGQSAEPDHWRYRTLARLKAQRALDVLDRLQPKDPSNGRS